MRGHSAHPRDASAAADGRAPPAERPEAPQGLQASARKSARGPFAANRPLQKQRRRGSSFSHTHSSRAAIRTQADAYQQRPLQARHRPPPPRQTRTSPLLFPLAFSAHARGKNAASRRRASSSGASLRTVCTPGLVPPEANSIARARSGFFDGSAGHIAVGRRHGNRRNAFRETRAAHGPRKRGGL